MVNTYLVFLRFQCMRGVFDKAQYQAEAGFVREALGRLEAPHWKRFLAAWPADPQ